MEKTYIVILGKKQIEIKGDALIKHEADYAITDQCSNILGVFPLGTVIYLKERVGK